MEEPEDSLPPLFRDFRVTKTLKQALFGDIYLGVHLDTKTKVVIKTADLRRVKSLKMLEDPLVPLSHSLCMS